MGDPTIRKKRALRYFTEEIALMHETLTPLNCFKTDTSEIPQHTVSNVAVLPIFVCILEIKRSLRDGSLISPQ